jgi:hypothetical protein
VGLVRHELPERIGGFMARFRQCVRVYRECDLRICVPQQLRHCYDIPPGREQVAGERVSQVVEADLPNIGALQSRVEAGPQ